MAKFKNIEMEQMLTSLESLLGRTDIVGYAAARNTRLLRNETTEYGQRRDALVEKYGEKEVDDNGNDTGRFRLAFNSDNWKKYEEGIKEWALIEHDVPIMKVKPSDVIGKLTGEEILKIDWMIEDE